MKTRYFMLGLLLALTPLFLSAQTTAGLNYQAVLRNSSTYQPIGNQSGTATVSILNGGTELYREIHTINTDQLGLFNVIIGKGNALNGNFSAVDWGSAGRSVKIAVAVGGNNYDFAPTELQAVPYAKVAERSLQPGPVGPKGDKGDPGAMGPQGAVGSTGTYTAGSGISISGNVISNTGDADASTTNEIQTLSLSGDTLSLSRGGGSVTFNTSIKGYSNTPRLEFGVGFTLNTIDSVVFTLSESAKVYVQADVSMWGDGSACVGGIVLNFDSQQYNNPNEDFSTAFSDNPVSNFGNNKVTISTSAMKVLLPGQHKVYLKAGGFANNCDTFFHPHLNVLVLGKE